MADLAPITEFASNLKRPSPTAKAPKPRKRPMPGSVATAHSRASKPPEPMALARLMKTLAPMIANSGGR